MVQDGCDLKAINASLTGSMSSRSTTAEFQSQFHWHLERKDLGTS